MQCWHLGHLSVLDKDNPSLSWSDTWFLLKKVLQIPYPPSFTGDFGCRKDGEGCLEVRELYNLQAAKWLHKHLEGHEHT